MPPRSPYTIHLVVLLLILASVQVYLFVKARRRIRRSGLTPRFKSLLVASLALFVGFMQVPYIALFIGPEPGVRSAYAVLKYPFAVWSFGAIGTALLLGARDLVSHFRGRVRARRRNPRPVNLERRAFLGRAFGAVAATPMVATAYGATFDTGRLEIVRKTLPFTSLPPSFDGLTILQASDIHSGLSMDPATLRKLVQQMNALRPDLVLLTGDYISASMKDLDPFLSAFASLRAPMGVIAALGNHEYMYGRIDRIKDGIAEIGVTVIFPIAAKRGVSLTLSGHYHGGQLALSLPGVTLSAAHLVTPYPEGLFVEGRGLLYVNRGIGTTGPPVRLHARPELTLITLSRA
ncbi:MAG: metallophosphoesterase [Nitrospirae bacterium]|nr:metallophosphoesterase [Nitrospirota bacterium]